MVKLSKDKPLWEISYYPSINKLSAFYKNCKRQRKDEAKICQDCPFRKMIEDWEKTNA